MLPKLHSMCDWYIYPVLREEVVKTMWNIGASTTSDLTPELVGFSGPRLGANRSSYTAMDWKL